MFPRENNVIANIPEHVHIRKRKNCQPYENYRIDMVENSIEPYP